MVCGVVVLFLARWVVNETTLPDRLVAPLLFDDSSANAEAIVVLGAGVVGDCVPNVNSARRVIHAARLFRSGRAPIVVMTGGGAGGRCPVAESMMQFATELGVPRNSIILERRSQSTHENAQRVASLMRAEGISRLLLVTDRLHMRRARGVFEHQGHAVESFSVPIYEGHPDNVSMLWAALREAVAIGYYTSRGWMQKVPSRMRPEMRSRVETSAQQRADNTGPLVILGASYAGNWKIASVGDVAVVNAGAPGERTIQVLERFDRDVSAQQPRAVLVWGFINDIFAADDPAGASAQVKVNYTKMVERSRAAGIEPILATELTMRSTDGWLDTGRALIGRLRGRTSYRDRINQQVIALNQWVEEFGRSQGLLVLDFHSTLADAGGGRHPEFATDDGSHVTEAGYRALTDYADAVLSRHFVGVTRPRP